jgi:hypothetical protein
LASTVHVFISTGRFHSLEEVRRFIDKTYTDDGSGIPSAFILEVGLSPYEPGCIEAVHSDRPIPLHELLAEASYSEQWLSCLSDLATADTAICVFEPNRVASPESSSLDYCGSFTYDL